MSPRSYLKRTIRFVLVVLALALALSVTAALAQGKPAIKVMSPAAGAKITSTDIPVTVEVANFKLAPLAVGLPDKAGEGHIHVMIDGMTMGVLFNFYTTPSFTLPGTGIAPGKHKLIFDLASNTHVDMEDTAQEVEIDYQPTSPKAAPEAIANAGTPDVQVVSPADGATLGPKFTVQVKPSNFTPSLDLEGKPNLKGFGHYHVFVDMPAMTEGGGGAMMSMAGMVLMPGSNSFDVDLSAWPAGKHTLTVELVQNDHTPIEGAKPAMITINLQGTTGGGAAPGQLPRTGGDENGAALFAAILGILILLGGLLLRGRIARRA
jgi:LPXTG-motif cell wall-anchored protein